MGFSPSTKHKTTTSIYSSIVDATSGSFTEGVTAASGIFASALTVSGLPVITTDQVGITALVEDTTPELGGNLDAQSKDISNINELTAVTGTFTTGLTIGTGSTHITPDRITAASGTFTGSLAAGNLPGRNVLINGNFDIWQRGATFNQIAHAAYSADRFNHIIIGAGKIDVARSGTVPGGSSLSSLQLTVDTADAAMAATDIYALQQVVEGYNIQRFGFGRAAAKRLTLSFWVRSNITGTYCVAFKAANSDRNYIVEYTIASANTWEQKSITITAATTGSWNWDHTEGLRLQWALATGANFQATKDTWLSSSNTFSTSNQANWMATIGNTFYLSRVQLEIGDAATEFEHRHFGAELGMCKRYYEKVDVLCDNDAWTNITNAYIWETEKRTTPTFSTTPVAGSGAAFAQLGNWSFYQSASNSEKTSATVTADAEF